MRPNLRSVRSYLLKNSTVDAATAITLEDELPREWCSLIRAYGHAKVFDCIRNQMTIGGAKHFLQRRRA